MKCFKNSQLLVVVGVFSTMIAGASVYAGDKFADPSVRQKIIESSKFIPIPGPDRIIKTGEKDQWDDGFIEASDAFEDLGTYYFYYHGNGGGKSYRLGVATATSPLGPFKKYGDKPILDLGKQGSWDNRTIACGMVLKEGDEEYYMWYSGDGSGGGARGMDVGLAIAENPLGPWKRYEQNPVMEDTRRQGNH